MHVAVLFVDFSDAAATRTPQAAFSIISPGAAQFFEAVSYGRMHLVLDPLYTWLRMSKPTSGYPWNPVTFAVQKAFIQEAVQLAGASLDVSASNAILVITNPDATAIGYGPAFTANPGDGIAAGGKIIDNAATSGADLVGWATAGSITSSVTRWHSPISTSSASPTPRPSTSPVTSASWAISWVRPPSTSDHVDVMF